MEKQLSPQYDEILKEIGKQLKERRGLLLRRVLLIVWPYIFIAIASFIAKHFYEVNSFSEETQFQLLLLWIICLLSSVVYSIIMGFVFNIEKRIWIDSYFDGRPLTPAESQRISWKLAWPVFKLRFTLALLYYWVPIVMVIVAIFVGFFIYGISIGEAHNMAMSLMYTALASLFVIPIGVFVYQYWVRTKLRYAWFIFLDHYGHDYSFGLLKNEIKKLNDISKTDMFIKSLTVSVGADSLAAVSGMAVRGIGAGFGTLGDAGKLIGGVTRIYGEELARQVADLGNIAGQYILYRFSRKQLYGDEQKVNEVLYRLKD